MKIVFMNNSDSKMVMKYILGCFEIVYWIFLNLKVYLENV